MRFPKAVRSCFEDHEDSLRKEAGSRRGALMLLYRLYRSTILPQRVFPITNLGDEPDADLEFGPSEWAFPRWWPSWARWGRRRGGIG